MKKLLLLTYALCVCSLNGMDEPPTPQKTSTLPQEEIVFDSPIESAPSPDLNALVGHPWQSPVSSLQQENRQQPNVSFALSPLITPQKQSPDARPLNTRKRLSSEQATLFTRKQQRINEEFMRDEFPLHTAIRAHNKTLVKKLIANNVDLQEKGPDGLTPLELAEKLHQEIENEVIGDRDLIDWMHNDQIVIMLKDAKAFSDPEPSSSALRASHDFDQALSPVLQTSDFPAAQPHHLITHAKQHFREKSAEAQNFKNAVVSDDFGTLQELLRRRPDVFSTHAQFAEELLLLAIDKGSFKTAPVLISEILWHTSSQQLPTPNEIKTPTEEENKDFSNFAALISQQPEDTALLKKAASLVEEKITDNVPQKAQYEDLLRKIRTYLPREQLPAAPAVSPWQRSPESSRSSDQPFQRQQSGGSAKPKTPDYVLENILEGL